MVRQAKDIRLLLERRLQMWNDEQYEALLQEALMLDRKLAHRRQTSMNKEHVVQVFHRLMLRGKVREAVRWLTESGNSSVLAPYSRTNSGKTVFEELREKHPDPITPDPSLLRLPNGMDMPPLLPVQITGDHVEKVARKLHGGSGPNGSASEQWADFLLRHSRASQRLRDSIKLFSKQTS
ncbi:Hypothetical protein NTJ_11244 [Nesidiocoris tenuis]|uniref:Uncharacterized protein n=1 Tax=Nesidiocoris tenuis TaxID=355587 RepID=A0ABN7B499_9HEMI|nr:Hypothetical protein NTJ_11244 [Nesidiocoris tenuis]